MNAAEAAWRRGFDHAPHTCVVDTTNRWCVDCGKSMRGTSSTRRYKFAGLKESAEYMNKAGTTPADVGISAPINPAIESGGDI
jgi:hypothetical protein